MSRRASRLISSQTSNWISTSTDPCSALFGEMEADWADAGVGAKVGAKTVEFVVSIGRPTVYVYYRLLSQKEDRIGSGQVDLYLSTTYVDHDRRDESVGAPLDGCLAALGRDGRMRPSPRARLDGRDARPHTSASWLVPAAEPLRLRSQPRPARFA